MERSTNLLFGALAFESNPARKQSWWNLGGVELERRPLIRQRMSAQRALEFRERHDVAGEGFVDRLLLFANYGVDLPSRSGLPVELFNIVVSGLIPPLRTRTNDVRPAC